MTITELVKKLNNYIKEYGDIELFDDIDTYVDKDSESLVIEIIK